MKHWQELGQILDRVLRHAPALRPASLATVIRIRGSAYRRPGARLLIEEDGAFLGGVSGGCLEEDVRQVGRQVLATGLSRLLHYETGEDEDRVWGLGLGCAGAVDVAVIPVTGVAVDTWTRVRRLLDGDQPFAVSVTAEDGGPGAMEVALEPQGGSSLHSAGARAVFTEVLQPPLDLLVCGAGDDARPLTAFAAAAGFRVTVADHRPAYLTAARFPDARTLVPLRPEDAQPELPVHARTYAVVMTHSLARDSAWLRRLAATQAPYIGVLGPRGRTERLLAELPERVRRRVFGPVGLDLGAEGPEQVALSILAEALAVAAGREPRHLRERLVGVHA